MAYPDRLGNWYEKAYCALQADTRVIMPKTMSYKTRNAYQTTQTQILPSLQRKKAYQHSSSPFAPSAPEASAMDAFFDAVLPSPSSIPTLSQSSPSEYGVPVDMEEANKNSNTYCVIA